MYNLDAILLQTLRQPRSTLFPYTTLFRSIIVASMGKISFPDCIAVERTMAEILQSPEDPECEWFTRETKAHVFNGWEDRKSTRLNSSHPSISYAVFCLKKKK